MGTPEDSSRSAVLVPIPAVEPAVGGHRRILDSSAAWGVPAHVTVLYPFVEPADIDDDVLRRLTAAVSGVPAFDCTFARCRWFDHDLLWLAPEPAQPFRDLTSAVWHAFPDHPPYGGSHADVVPHLTVGVRRGDQWGALVAAEVAVSSHLPIRTHVDRALLMSGRLEPASWRILAEFRLGTDPG